MEENDKTLVTTETTSELKTELTNLKKQLDQKDKESKKLKSNIDDLKEMLRLQKEQMTKQFDQELNLAKEKLYLALASDHIIYQNEKHKPIHISSCKELMNQVRLRNIDENYLAFVISKY